MSDALRPLRILDLTQGPAGGLATMILADFGAEVIAIERPRSHLNAKPAASMWRRGKTLLTLDLNTTADARTLETLCAAADVLVVDWRPKVLAQRGLAFDDLHPRHPHLIVCHITGFGAHGPLADMPGYEHLVAAYCGRMRLFSGTADRRGPVFSALQVGVHACAQSATVGILAAELARGEDGGGRLVETSMLQGMQPYEQGAMLGTQFAESDPGLGPFTQPLSDSPPPPSLYYHPAQAGDGRWMQFGNLLPHLFDNFLIVTDLIDVTADPAFNPQQLLLEGEAHERFRQRMLERIQTRAANAWMQDFIANGGVVAANYQTTQEALRDPDIVANGHVIEREDGGIELGPLARLTKTPAEPGGFARENPSLVTQWVESPRAAPSRLQDTKLPLTGIKVVEIATIIAAPFGASLLADLGAEVIKIEQIGGDPYRGLLAGVGAARVNAGKRSISLNLKSKDGLDIALRLIDEADVVIHNFRPGVPERLGIGYEQVSKRNPQIIYLQANGYGPDGPGAQRPSTHPIPGAAMGGVMFQMGERLPDALQDFESLRNWTSRLMRANEVNPDPNTALVVATSVLLGLSARKRIGSGQRIMVDMFGANAYANHDDFLDYPGKPPRAIADPQLHGPSDTYRLYPCDRDQWVFLALLTPQERQRFCEVVAELGYTVDATALGASELTSLFKHHTADHWEAVFVEHGVGCVRADGAPPNEFWLKDPHVAANGWLQGAEHPVWGSYQRHGPMVVFDAEPRTAHAAPLAGQHNAEVLAQLGMNSEQIENLYQNGIIWSEN